jgi:hypothetical protein
MSITEEITLIASKSQAEPNQFFWTGLIELFKTLGGDLESCEAALDEALEVAYSEDEPFQNLSHPDILIKSAVRYMNWPGDAPAEGYFEAPQEVFVGLVEEALEAKNQELAKWALSLKPDLDYILLGLVANPVTSNENIMSIVSRDPDDPILATALMHPSLSRSQIEDIFRKVKDAAWVVNAVNKAEGFEIAQYQWPFKVAGYDLQQSKNLWEEILESITEFIGSGEDRFDLFEGLMEQVEETGLSDEVVEFIKSDSYLLSLAKASGWEYLEQLV